MNAMHVSAIRVSGMVYQKINARTIAIAAITSVDASG
jgi:hypothetical protein